MRIAGKLNGRRISLITGVEYLHTTKTARTTRSGASLHSRRVRIPSLMLTGRTNKPLPSMKSRAVPPRQRPLNRPCHEMPSPPIIQHGDFRFALLNCSELTNIRYGPNCGARSTLFVPE